MEFEKTIVKKIEFTPKEISSPKLQNDELIIEKIQNLYVGKCTNTCYIVEFISIINKGNIKVNSSENNGNVYIDVVFNCKVITLDKGSIIIDAKHYENDNNTIIYEKPYAYIYCERNKYKQLHKDNAIICVNESMYKEGSSKILVYGRIFLNERIQYNFKIINSELEMLELKEIKKLYKDYLNIYNNYKSIENNKYIKEFSDIFYPYIEKQSIATKNNITIEKFIEKVLNNDINDIENYIFTFSPKLPITTNIILLNDNNKKDNNIDNVNNKVLDIFNFSLLVLSIKKQTYNFMITLNDICNKEKQYYQNLNNQIQFYKSYKI